MVEIDVMAGGQRRRCAVVVPGALELVGAPALDLAHLLLVDKFCRSHCFDPLSIDLYNTFADSDVPTTREREDLTEDLHGRENALCGFSTRPRPLRAAPSPRLRSPERAPPCNPAPERPFPPPPTP